MDALLTNRRAKLWDLFTELYRDIHNEAEDDFHAVFGKEFLRAYQAQIAKLEALKRYLRLARVLKYTSGSAWPGR